ncbi:MAG: hypothetical protein KF753_18070 [Caldilineaceae bacterium]|nr:hypothetical protein [Caldilineaceae bacterium]
MLHLFESNPSLFKSWRVVRYEQEGDAYLLQLSAVLQDDSRLELRDYLFVDGSRKYAYQWMESNGSLRRRWDNAPHWPSISTTPHHTHTPDKERPIPSTVTNLEDLIAFVQEWFTQ